MEHDFFTVEQIAQKLDLHPKTIRRFIQDGRLKAHKVGKQWRVTTDDLKDFLGNNDTKALETDDQNISESLTDNSGYEIKHKIQISAVVDIFVDDVAEASRITNTLFAVLNCKDPSYGNSRCDHIFYKNELKARFILWGNPKFISDMIECIAEICEYKP